MGILRLLRGGDGGCPGVGARLGLRLELINIAPGFCRHRRAGWKPAEEDICGVSATRAFTAHAASSTFYASDASSSHKKSVSICVQGTHTSA